MKIILIKIKHELKKKNSVEIHRAKIFQIPQKSGKKQFRFEMKKPKKDFKINSVENHKVKGKIPSKIKKTIPF